MAQTLTLTLEQIQLLAQNSTSTLSVVGSPRGVDQPKNFKVSQLAPLVTSLDLRIDVKDIQRPRPPSLANYQIQSITINGRRYTDSTAWTQAWAEYYQQNQPQQSLANSRTLSEHQVLTTQILLPGTNRTLASAAGIAAEAQTIIVSVPADVPALPLLDEVVAVELDLSVIDVTVTPGGQLSTVYADSSQNLQDLPQVPLNSVLGWYGNLTQIPLGYVLCDGSLDTPDLSAQFITDPDPDLQFVYVKKTAI